ncbi:MAG: hypothetical protein ABFS10_08810 [Bacteroidota bacterium]
MHKTITRSLSIATLLILMVGTGRLLAQSEEQIEQFKQERKAYFKEKLELTPAEEELFWPLYNDYHNRKIRIVEDERNTFRYSHDNADNLSNQEVSETLNKISRLKKELYELETRYYQSKFPEILPPEKVLKLYQVEWDFRGHLIRKIRGHGQGGPDGRGGRGGRNKGGYDQLPAPGL